MLRSHRDRLRVLLADALIAIAGLTGAVVIIAKDGGDATTRPTTPGATARSGRAERPSRPDPPLPQAVTEPA